jgi:hypothetical protein
MRHSRIELTMNLPAPRLRQAGLYTDPALLDVAGAVRSLPDFAAKQVRPRTCVMPTAGA